MSLKRKTFVAITLLVFSTTSLFILSHKVFLSQIHSSRRSSLHEKNAILQAPLQGHLAQLIDAQVKWRTKDGVVENRTLPPDVAEVDTSLLNLLRKQKSAVQNFQHNLEHKNGGNISLLRRQKSVQKYQTFPGENSAVSINPKGTVSSQCQLAPKACLQEDDLQVPEMERVANCFSEAIAYVKLQREHSGNNVSLAKCSCHLRRKNLDNRRVALVSLPGSGNTWVRGLLERSTNICTGSMWCDPNLRATHFCAEGSHSRRTLVVKNHDPTIRWRGEVLPNLPNFSESNKPEFDGAIFVHRDPFDAIVADRNREIGYTLWERAIDENHILNSSIGHHVQSFGVEYFRDNIQWKHGVKMLIRSWEAMIYHLLIKNRNVDRVLVVKYEDLVKNTEHEVLRMLGFLGYSIAPDLLKERLKIEFSAFKRNHVSNVFKHFTTTQKRLINSVINSVSSRLNSHLLPLKEYVRSLI